MIRVVAFLLLAGLAAAGGVWLAERPGEIAITWIGYRVDTSIMVAVAALIVLLVLSVLLWSLLLLLLRSPKIAVHALDLRRRRRGHDAITRGLIAVGAGDMRTALRYAGNAERNVPDEPLALLLRAQTAQLAGDQAAADAAFRAMAGRPDMRLLGLRGLYIEAQRRNDLATAGRAAEEAARDAPKLAWARQAVFEFRSGAGDWEGALAVLEETRKSRALDRDTYRRRRAVLLAARALAVEEGDRDTARSLAMEAVKLAPGLVPAAALAGRLLAEAGDTRRASRILETAWKQSPHPDLADVYAHVRLSDSARDRLARVERLARDPAGHAEGALAVARAAIDAREFVTARNALAPLIAQPTQRVALLMAELERVESNNEGLAREWMARALRAARDPAWTADGFVSDRWLPVSPVTGRLDAFEWKVPLSQLGSGIAEVEEPVLVEAAREIVSPPLNGTAGPENREEPAAVPPPPPAAIPAPPAAPAAAPPPTRSAARPIVPLARVPDDPGPEPEAILDVGLAPEPAPAWQRIRQLFR
jgi:HemY protein